MGSLKLEKWLNYCTGILMAVSEIVFGSLEGVCGNIFFMALPLPFEIFMIVKSFFGGQGHHVNIHFRLP